MDTAAIEYWSEGYLSGLAAGSYHDVIGQFRREDLAAWLTRYCTANPQTRIPLAIHALGRIGKLVLLAVALALTLSMTGCAATGPGAPLNSHGVDYYPAFNSVDVK